MENVEQTTTVEGSNNVAFNVGSVGRDLHVGDVHILQDTQFFETETSLDEFNPDRWIDPPQSRELTRRLTEHRLLILAGDMDPAAKSDCAKQLAYILHKQITESGVKARVRERLRGKDPQRIEPALQGGEPVILLLIEVTPSQIAGSSLSKLRSQLRQYKSYALITTECSRGEWSIENGNLEAQLWYELSWETYFGRELLSQFLVSQLTNCDRMLSEDILLESSERLPLIAGLPVGNIVETLKLPSRLQDFAQWLLASDGGVTADQVQKQLARLAGDEAAIEEWYRQLDFRDQLLALGLTLFDGLPDDLLFTGLEILVDSTWRTSDPQLPHFDHRDLSPFSAYFKQVDSGHGFFRVQTESEDRRQQLLKIAWKLQRRRLLATLPALTALIQISAAGVSENATTTPNGVNANGVAGSGRPEDRKLRFSADGSRQLHQALADSLSIIGLLSIDVVSPYYLDLAANPAESVQQFASRALSAWRDTGHESQFFSLLRCWWDAACDYEKDHPLLARVARPGEDPRATIRAAAALILGYASRFDRPNRLAAELYELFVALIDDRDPRVQAPMRSSTILHVVTWHFRQVEPLLRTKVVPQSEEALVAVAVGAAGACLMRPEESLAILDGWRSMAKADRRRTSPLHREKLLATVALTYGYIRCEVGTGPLSPEAIGARLRSMLVEESSPYVRHYIFYALEIQAVRNFEVVSIILQDLLSHVSLRDRPAAVEVFVRTYLHQRQRLPGGDKRVDIGERSYGVWTYSVRPLTEIEAALYGWIMDDSRPIAQQLAVDIFEAIAETAIERTERKLPRSSSPSSPAMQLAPAEGTLPKVHALPVLGWMALFLATWRKQRVRAILKPLLAEVIVVQARTEAPRATVSSQDLRLAQAEKPRLRADHLLTRWTGVSNEATQAVARYLRKALSLYRWRWGIVAAALLSLYLLYVGSGALYHRLTQPPAPEESTETPAPTESEAPAPGDG